MGDPRPAEGIDAAERELGGPVVTVVQHQAEGGEVWFEAIEGRPAPEDGHPHVAVLKPGEAVRVSSNRTDLLAKWFVAVRIVENRDGQAAEYVDHLRNRNGLAKRGVTVLDPLI